jgi:hypothetical protein
MEKSKIYTAVLVTALLTTIVVGANEFALWATNKVKQDEINTQIQFGGDLTAMKTQVANVLRHLNESLISAANQLSNVDLHGSQADLILSQLNQNSSYIVNSATCDANDIILDVQPSSYSSIVGEDISMQTQNIAMHQTLKPAMSDVIGLVEGFNGVVMVAPIFDAQNNLKGSLSIVILPSQILKDASNILSGAQFRTWTIQTNGTILYDSQNETKIGLPLTFVSFRIGNFSFSGRQNVLRIERNETGNFEYFATVSGTALGTYVQEQVAWTTVGMYDKSWRLAVIRVLSD